MKKKNSIEKIKRNTLTFYAKHKSVLKAISAIAAYILIPEIAMWPIKVFVVNNNVFPYIARVIYLLLVDVLLASTLLYIYVDEIMVMFADIKKNNKKYFDEYFKYWLIAMALMIISNLIISMFVKSEPANQQAIIDMFKRNPIYIFMSAVIFAPIIEELVYRFSFRKLFKNDWVFIIVSGLIFGFAHLGAADNLVNELVFLIPYSIPGFMFSYVLVKSKNIFVPMGLHFMHNGLLIAIQFLALIFM